jgi:hypothetical protein
VPADLPHAVASTRDVAAFFFADPLLAGRPHRGEPQNKVLWVVRGGARTPLVITARSSNSGRVRVVADSGGSSGQVQRTILTLPKPGCWRLDLSWDDNRARLDVQVEARAAKAR